MYASMSTQIYWIEYAPGKFVRRVKEAVTKSSLKEPVNQLFLKGKKKK